VLPYGLIAAFTLKNGFSNMISGIVSVKLNNFLYSQFIYHFLI